MNENNNKSNELRIESFVQRWCNCSLEFDNGKIVVESRIFILIRMTYDSRNVFVFCFLNTYNIILPLW